MLSNNNEELTPRPMGWLLILGGVFLLGAMFFSFLLAGTKLGFYVNAPGCGPASGCGTITSGPWGSIPVIKWPISFVGIAWFFSLACGWFFGHIKRPRFIWIIRLGVLGSVGFFVVMFFLGYFCKWCALSHICNILFWIVAEFMYVKECGARKMDKKQKCPSFLFVSVFVATSILLGGVYFINQSKQRNQEEAAAVKNSDAVVMGGVDNTTLELLQARHTIGPKNAPVKIVVFTDYQCPDCKRYEAELSNLVRTRDDVSLSIKNFPMCADCNTFMNGRTLHGNACWAARASEAAKILGGQVGWEKMHEWLFSVSGSFTDKSFGGDLNKLGFDPQKFIPLMTSNQTLELVEGDTRDAVALGVYYTPMIFVNGVEYLWYYSGKQESFESLVNRAIDRIEVGVVSVAPPTAKEKLIQDWKVGKSFSSILGKERLSWSGDGPIEIVVWGDYQADFTLELNREIDEFMNKNPGIFKYAFRHFPIDPLCNSMASGFKKQYEGSCYLAKLVESADLLSGSEARWKVHNWIMKQPGSVDLELALQQVALITGFDMQTIQDTVGGAEVNNRLRQDVMSKNSVWRKGIPVVLVDNRYLPKWKSDLMPAQEIFQRIVEGVGSGEISEESR